jgi:SAM-dependent methyltransferase
MAGAGEAGAGEHYVLATGEAGARRLHLLDEVYGPSTDRLLDGLVCPGMSVADIGCGVGMVAGWLARRVGPGGAAVGVDLSEEQVALARRDAAAQRLDQLTFVVADAYDTGLPRGAFDVVCCRSLLSHLRRPEDALREMRSLLRDGGVLLAEDLDMTVVASDPPTGTYARVAESLVAICGHIGSDPAMGADLEARFRAIGHDDVRVSVDRPVDRAGERKRLWEYTFLELAPAYLEAGLMTSAEITDLARELALVSADDSIAVLHAPKYQVWARRAGGAGPAAS